MKKTEKCILAALTVLLGVLLIIFQEAVIKIAMVAIGLAFIAFGVMDFFRRSLPLAAVKIVAGLIALLFGIFVVHAVLYLLAGILLIVGILLLYERVKAGLRCQSLLQKILSFASPCICLLIGILFLFNGGDTPVWIFVLGGILVTLEGAALSVDAFLGD